MLYPLQVQIHLLDQAEVADSLHRVSGIQAVLGTALCSIAFYLITSTQAWGMSPIYAKTFAGWLQAVTTGDPAYQPQAWVFMVKALISDLGFALLLLAAYKSEASVRRVEGMPWTMARA